MIPTRSHELIRIWAAKHGAVPAEVKRLVHDGEVCTLHFLFGKARSGTPDLRPISWDDFFARFDLMDLALAYEEQGSDFNLVRMEKAPPVLSH